MYSYHLCNDSGMRLCLILHVFLFVSVRQYGCQRNTALLLQLQIVSFDISSQEFHWLIRTLGLYRRASTVLLLLVQIALFSISNSPCFSLYPLESYNPTSAIVSIYYMYYMFKFMGCTSKSQQPTLKGTTSPAWLNFTGLCATQLLTVCAAALWLYSLVLIDDSMESCEEHTIHKYSSLRTSNTPFMKMLLMGTLLPLTVPTTIQLELSIAVRLGPYE